MAVLLLAGAIFVGFWNTGGKSLVGVYQNYLSQNIPDKQYSWKDFTDREPREMLHGYYAGSDSGGFYMWTLSGLKRFTHKQETSVQSLLAYLLGNLLKNSVDSVFSVTKFFSHSAIPLRFFPLSSFFIQS